MSKVKVYQAKIFRLQQNSSDYSPTKFYATEGYFKNQEGKPDQFVFDENGPFLMVDESILVDGGRTPRGWEPS